MKPELTQTGCSGQLCEDGGGLRIDGVDHTRLENRGLLGLEHRMPHLECVLVDGEDAVFVWAKVPFVVVVFDAGRSPGAVMHERLSNSVRMVQRHGMNETWRLSFRSVHMYPVFDEVVDVKQRQLVHKLPVPS